MNTISTQRPSLSFKQRMWYRADKLLSATSAPAAAGCLQNSASPSAKCKATSSPEGRVHALLWMSKLRLYAWSSSAMINKGLHASVDHLPGPGWFNLMASGKKNDLCHAYVSLYKASYLQVPVPGSVFYSHCKEMRDNWENPHALIAMRRIVMRVVGDVSLDRARGMIESRAEVMRLLGGYTEEELEGVAGVVNKIVSLRRDEGVTSRVLTYQLECLECLNDVVASFLEDDRVARAIFSVPMGQLEGWGRGAQIVEIEEPPTPRSENSTFDAALGSFRPFERFLVDAKVFLLFYLVPSVRNFIVGACGLFFIRTQQSEESSGDYEDSLRSSATKAVVKFSDGRREPQMLDGKRNGEKVFRSANVSVPKITPDIYYHPFT